jgi:hypothetical protein
MQTKVPNPMFENSYLAMKADESADCAVSIYNFVCPAKFQKHRGHPGQKKGVIPCIRELF